MITLSNLHFAFGNDTIFDNVTVAIKDRQKIGLVGKNGAGKSTLFKLLVGEYTPDGGSISIPTDTSVGYLSQFLSLDEKLTARQGAALAFAKIHQIEKDLENLNQELTTRTDYESDDYATLIEKITTKSIQLESYGGSQMEGSIEKVLYGLGFNSETIDSPISELSGGWKMRVELAKLLLEAPDFLLLDEPVNHLDIESIIWLEKWLQNYSGSYIIIAHDQEFLDNTVEYIFEVDHNTIEEYKGNYSKYLIEKALRQEQKKSAFENQQKTIAHKERLIERFKAKASKASMAKSLAKELDRMDKVSYRDDAVRSMNFYFLPAKRENQIVASTDNLSKSFGEKNVLSAVDFEIERGEKVAFVGQNGQGKTTLAKILIGVHDPSTGSSEIGSNVQVAYFAQDAADKLPRNKTLLEYMEESADEEVRKKVRSILGSFLFSGDDVEKKISVLSGGEKNRLVFAHLFLKPFNLLLLDEPTHHLDIQAKEVLKQALAQYKGTMIIVSHDRGFLDGLVDRVVEFADGKIKNHLGDIRYFLEKKETNSMRQVEMKTAQEDAPIATAKKEIPPQEVKKKQKDLERLEKQIQRLESTIGDLEADLAASYATNETNPEEIITNLQNQKKSLQSLMSEWENLAMEVDQF